WFRDDQRLSDNPALSHAVSTGNPVVCVYVYDPAPKLGRAMGGRAKVVAARVLEKTRRLAFRSRRLAARASR
ncbi:deoxyribodipyrimidine photo-lyase, partial [Burkholderia cenocepacia]|uniref:deoxyribodipyrimidine photo-lyase n=1 Tax=Burkholderia cenocepacia TaxID=95486 RepID=UPI0024B192E4